MSLNRSIKNEVEMERLILKKDVEFVRVELADTYGCSRGLLVNAPYFLKNYKKGFAKTQSLLTLTPGGDFIAGTGYLDEVSYRNFRFVPELSTFTVLPWLDKTASILVDIYDGEKPDSPLHPASSRNICKKQLDELVALGYRFYSAFEYEFYVLNPDTRKYLYDTRNFCSVQYNGRFDSLSNDILRNLDKIGMQPEFVHSENGPSQLECPIGASFGITGSDNAFRMKQLVKEIARQHGHMANFMTKPFKDCAGSSGHFNHSLWDAYGKNVFYDPECNYGLSKVAQHWLAGLVYHSETILCFMSSTPNCIERTNVGGFAPVNNAWALDNRSVAYRVKDPDTTNVYLEQRLAGAAANPYLVTAACIVAGLDGIKRELELEGDPYEGEISKATVLPEHVKTLPKTLSASIDCLENNETFVKAFGSDFIKLYSTLKRYEDNLAEKQGCNSNKFEWYMTYYGEYV